MSRSTTPQIPPQDIPTSATRFIGCDVGKASIVVCDSRDGSVTTIANKPASLDAFMSGLDDTCLIVCEATGGYEDALLDAAVRAGRAAHRADARKVKAFIRSFGILGKTAPSTPRRSSPTRGSARPRWADGSPAIRPAIGSRRSS